MPNEIENIQIKINKINYELRNSNLYIENYRRFNEITDELDMLKQKLALKEDRWLEILEMEESINID